jgi:light-regulated signal transduction histidine kinase (bacteriophytochrome)
MVSSYTQLLQRRYADKLDDNAREFMAFVVDGASRMKQLIEDLLRYDRAHPDRQ